MKKEKQERLDKLWEEAEEIYRVLTGGTAEGVSLNLLAATVDGLMQCSHRGYPAMMSDFIDQFESVHKALLRYGVVHMQYHSAGTPELPQQEQEAEGKESRPRGIGFPTSLVNEAYANLDIGKEEVRAEG